MDHSLSDAEVQARFARHLQMQIDHILVLLGRIPLPGMEAMEPRLPEARELIDHLEALEVKTRGNLQPHEQAFLGGALTELRLAYVEACQGRRTAAAPSPSSPVPPEPAGAEGVPPPPISSQESRQAPSSTEEGKKKFFKSYG
ncbi:hypothetical protein MAMC_00396 [Methylacidimicrobium cyclopophantes]|uniref:DUF1844 domain-containing protein n=1 Tax=Methylacidimicrobium cyclopophantes TaxID=1041766 RepID=A0A5E6M6A6_9BACT|nr:DUF1844 domain-containing protein [Methylacidimicrobium cyclopophantes]VVM05084.1 hypothetical protein MAMC_00396 [Methylacidimicrobium cyclopophantes]